MNGVEQKLTYLQETKKLIKNSINDNGGEIAEDTPFDEYPQHIQKVIDTKIISQSTLDSLTSSVLDINGTPPLRFRELKLIPCDTENEEFTFYSALGAEVYGPFNTGDVIQIDDHTSVRIGYMRPLIGSKQYTASNIHTKDYSGIVYDMKFSELSANLQNLKYVQFALYVKVMSDIGIYGYKYETKRHK